MPLCTNHIDLDVSCGYSGSPIFAKQGDENSRVIEISLYDKGVAADISGCYAVFKLQNPKGHLINLNADIVGNKVSVTLSKQCLAFSGDALCAVSIIDNSDRVLSSCNFVLTIVPAPEGTDYNFSMQWLKNVSISAEDFASMKPDEGTVYFVIDGGNTKLYLGSRFICESSPELSEASIVSPKTLFGSIVFAEKEET